MLPPVQKSFAIQGQMDQNTSPAAAARSPKPLHHPDVYRYRISTTDKCLKEICAAEARAASGTVIGSADYFKISQVCDQSCGAKYHWCPTCFITPRCDCMMPHFSRSGQGQDTTWYLDQPAAVARFKHLACDNRYWTAVNKIRAVATDGQSDVFCELCVSSIKSLAAEINAVYGRTYLEQMHHIWKIIGDDVCQNCIAAINALECAHSNFWCPSNSIRLVSDRLINYQSRTYAGERKAPWTESIKNANQNRKYTPRPITKSTAGVSSDREHKTSWNASVKITKAPKVPICAKVPISVSIPDTTGSHHLESEDSPPAVSSPHESFAILPYVISSALDDAAPMLLASQLMDLWFPESDDDAPLGSTVSTM